MNSFLVLGIQFFLLRCQREAKLQRVSYEMLQHFTAIKIRNWIESARKKLQLVSTVLKQISYLKICDPLFQNDVII